MRCSCSSMSVWIKGTCLLPQCTSDTYDFPRSLFGIDSSSGTSSRAVCYLSPNSSWVASFSSVLPNDGSFQVASEHKLVVTGGGVVPVTCLFLVLHLLPVRALYTCVTYSWLLSTCSSLTCSSRNSKDLSSAQYTISILPPPV